jgi:hypothetical protein
MNALLLDENKCSVLIAEYATGHIYKSNLTKFMHGDNEKDIFQIFNNLIDARNYALDFVQKNPNFECTVFNNNGDFISLYNKKGERK